MPKKEIYLECPKCGSSRFRQNTTETLTWVRGVRGSKGAKPVLRDKVMSEKFSCLECNEEYRELSELKEAE